MFEIGFPELILIAVVGLLVIGPERLPEALRTLGLWLGRMRRSFNNVRSEIEREIGMDEIRRQLHNEAVMEEMKRIQRDVRQAANPPAPRPADANAAGKSVAQDATPPPSSAAPSTVPSASPPGAPSDDPDPDPAQGARAPDGPASTGSDEARHG